MTFRRKKSKGKNRRKIMFTKNRVSFKNTTIDDKKFVTQRDEM